MTACLPRLGAIAVLAALASACTTQSLACRDADAAERSLFAAIVAHDQNRVASLMAAEGRETANRLRALDPEIQAQLFGTRMGDRSVRTVMMRPPLCLIDEPQGSNARVTYVFPAGRFDALQNPGMTGLQTGEPGYDHAACRFVMENGQWRLADACLTTFRPRPAVG
ncbi:hypothetical protein F1654_07800 [Alkalicaulis satelles]|uniref:Nuclear transport factor 2 family protein n=1 Tax=Alkalicaulis satelles TaxID=2609175 RepID=A0A5M6ZG22_9PROT|nr:hypothetical protein [Alkalicaulis satelles]KAA5803696.1 hypothetical protein F1654_07800 [Alkalicaulis satelles]